MQRKTEEQEVQEYLALLNKDIEALENRLKLGGQVSSLASQIEVLAAIKSGELEEDDLVQEWLTLYHNIELLIQMVKSGKASK